MYKYYLEIRYKIENNFLEKRILATNDRIKKL